MITRGGPGLVPGGLVERRVSLFIASEIAQTQTEVVIRLTVVRVRVAASQPPDGFLEMHLGGGKLSAAQMPQTHGIVAACIRWVTAQSLAPVKGRTAGCVAVLFKVQPRNIKLVSAVNVCWQ